MASKTTSSKPPIKRRIFLLYPYYWPLYKAGGPVQSLYNLVARFSQEVDFYLISLNKDVDGELPEYPLTLKAWNDGPNNEKIFSTTSISPLLIYRLVKEVHPHVILVNGIFHWNTSLFGILIGKWLGYSIVISPRGMLQAWALKRGERKKAIYLLILKGVLGQHERWHATDDLEKIDIFKMFGKEQRVAIASNVPRLVGHYTTVSFPDHLKKIKLVFLSLINPNKNLHLIIEAVIRGGGTFTLDIYGPIIDEVYWQNCNSRIKTSSFISYKGAIPSWRVPETLRPYHFFILPTLGENFGHAIFDALSSGVPVIITRSTPWKDLDLNKAGFYINLEDADSLDGHLNSISKMSQFDYDQYRTGSYAYAKNYFDRKNYGQEYSFLLD